MNRNLLYVVQRVLEKLDLDVVNSINDTQDSILIAREAEDTFYDLINRNEWPERYDLIEIESVSDVNNPTALRLPTNVLKMSSLRYDVTQSTDIDDRIQEIEQLNTEEFLDRIYRRSSSEDDIVEANYKGVPLYIFNNQPPTFYTTFDNELIILDSWDISVETTVQGSKTVATASTIPTFESDDEFIIPLDATTFPLYLAEVTAAISVYLNGTISPEDERRRNRGISRLRRSAFRTGVEDPKNRFGREDSSRFHSNRLGRSCIARR